jgi:hypothetical protein
VPISENPTLAIRRDPKALKVAVPDAAGLDLATVQGRDRVLAAILEAMASGSITPAAGRAYGYIVSVAANDAARELEGLVDRLVARVEELQRHVR